MKSMIRVARPYISEEEIKAAGDILSDVRQRLGQRWPGHVDRLVAELVTFGGSLRMERAALEDMRQRLAEY